MLGSLLALAAFACYLASAVLLVALHLRASGYSPVRHALSDFGVGPTRRAFALYAWLGSAGALALAATLWVKGPPVPAWLLGVLLVMVAARAGVVLLPTDLEGHSFPFIASTCAVSAGSTTTGPRWRPLVPEENAGVAKNRYFSGVPIIFP
jgi:hypothetical membrane protein